MMNRVEMNDTMMAQVNGGTFDRNKYRIEEYRACGVYLDRNFFAKDDFTMLDPDGNNVKITYEQANYIVEYVTENGCKPSMEKIRSVK